MKLINKNNNHEINDIYAMEIITDFVTYSLYENHKDITLLLNSAKILHIEQNGTKNILCSVNNGIGKFENNIFYYLSCETTP